MPKKSKQINILPDSTIITVVAESPKEILVKDMTYGEAKALLKRKNKFKYKFYQQGFCSIESRKK